MGGAGAPGGVWSRQEACRGSLRQTSGWSVYDSVDWSFLRGPEHQAVNRGHSRIRWQPLITAEDVMDADCEESFTNIRL